LFLRIARTSTTVPSSNTNAHHSKRTDFEFSTQKLFYGRLGLRASGIVF